MAFIADNFRLMAMGKISAHELEGFLEQELEAMEHTLLQPSRSLHAIGQAMPGFGILAAIMGIIITMGSIDGSIAEVGAKVAAALVGTFLGIFFCYCVLEQRNGTAGQDRAVGAGVRPHHADRPSGRQADPAGGGRRPQTD